MVQTGQSYSVLFHTFSPVTGALQDADSTPAGTLYVGVTSNGASVTVTNISTGFYKATVTLPTLAVRDQVRIRITATIDGTSFAGIFGDDSKDLVVDTSGNITSTVSDKAGYSLSQSFPSNFSALSIDSSGRVDVGKWLGNAVPATNQDGVPIIDISYVVGSAVGHFGGYLFCIAQNSGIENLANLDVASSTLATATNLAAVKTDTGNLISRLGAWTGTGINTVLGAFKALLSKIASAPSDIGGTFDPATDSLEALRDRGDSAWVTGSGASASDIANALAGAHIEPIVGAAGGRVIDIFKGDDYTTDSQRTWRIVKVGNDPGEPWPNDLTGHTITLTATKASSNTNDGNDTVTITGAIVTATGDGQEVSFNPASTTTALFARGWGALGYSFKVTATITGLVKTLASGKMNVR